MQALLEAVQRAVEHLRADGIQGWGLSIPDEIGGEVAIVSPSFGCTSETCAHNSHSPAAPIYKWIPPKGSKLTRLGDGGEEEISSTYYHVQYPDGAELFLELRSERHYHSRLRIIAPDDVPDFLLAPLAKEVRA